MTEFTDEEIVIIHDILKKINVVRKLPKETDYYVGILTELFDITSLDERLAIYLYMAHSTVLELISQREEETGKSIEEKEIMEID